MHSIQNRNFTTQDDHRLALGGVASRYVCIPANRGVHTSRIGRLSASSGGAAREDAIDKAEQKRQLTRMKKEAKREDRLRRQKLKEVRK